MIGVYRIRNTRNGRAYVGSSAACVFDRLYQHVKALNRGAHKNAHLQAAWNLYGETSFEIEIAESIVADPTWEPKRLALYVEAREQFHLDALPRPLRYNMCPVAGSRFGSKMSQAAKDKIGAHFRGKAISEEKKANLRIVNKGQGLGRKLSAETRAKMSASRTGRKLSPEHVASISAARLGKPLSEKHRAALSRGQDRRYTHEGRSRKRDS